MGQRKESPFTTGTGAGRLTAATRNSWAGLQAAWRLEAAFRQELLLTLVLLPVALTAPVRPGERALLLLTLGLLLVVEILNSAIEAVVDRVSLDRHELSGRAKDLGSAAVLLTLLTLAGVWGAILAPLAGHWLASAV